MRCEWSLVMFEEKTYLFQRNINDVRADFVKQMVLKKLFSKEHYKPSTQCFLEVALALKGMWITIEGETFYLPNSTDDFIYCLQLL